jgi:mono/diheme cytochrome c family protein
LKRLTALVAAPFLAWGVSLAISAAEPATAPVAAPVASQTTPPAAAAHYTAEQVERGRYLVEGVGMCGQCHSPRNAQGHVVAEQFLHGGPVPLLTPKGYQDKWAYKAPRLAGLPQHTDEQIVRLLTTGINRDGKVPMPPMPPFRMSAEDALAIAAYLRSVP